MSFKFMKLPSRALEQCLLPMEWTELFDLAMCSKRCNTLVKTLTKPHFRAAGSDFSRTPVGFKMTVHFDEFPNMDTFTEARYTASGRAIDVTSTINYISQKCELCFWWEDPSEPHFVADILKRVLGVPQKNSVPWEKYKISDGDLVWDYGGSTW